jgi:signal peptidase I
MDHSLSIVKNTRTFSRRELLDHINPNQSSKVHKFLGYFIIVFICVSLVYGFVRFGITETLKVDGLSMYPALQDNDKITIEKFWNKISGIKRGDSVVFNQKGKLVVKRVIGLPNEIVEIKDKKIYIYNLNHPQGIELFESSYVIGKTCKVPDCSVENDKTIVKENEYYVIGDNREASLDSRSIGSIVKDQIIGTVVWVSSKDSSGFTKEIKYNISKY